MDFKIKFKEAVFVRDESLDFQEKTVEPSQVEQEVVADTGFDGLKKVTVKEIPSNFQDVSATTAKKETVLQGERFISADGQVVEGTMPNNGAVLETIDTQKTSYTIPKGYHNGEGTVSLFVESKTIEPTKTTQIVNPSQGKVLSEVNISPIPEEYIIPKGSVSITENGSYNVRDYKDAVVNVPIPEGTKTITENGTYDVTEFAEAVVEVPKIDLTQATATEADVKEGKTFYAGDDTLKVGTNTGVDKIQMMLDSSYNGAQYLFYNSHIQDFTVLLEGVDFSRITDTSHMFQGCSGDNGGKGYVVPIFDTSNVTNMSNMFSYASPTHNAIKTVPLLNTSNVKNMSNMFSGAVQLTNVPQFDTRNVKNMSNMFENCVKLTVVPLFDTRNVTNMAFMFAMSKSNTYNDVLTEIPAFDTSNVTNMAVMFKNCRALITTPDFNTRKVTTINGFFDGCSSLTTVPRLDIRSATTTDSMFNKCSALTNCLICNIPTTLQVGSGTSYGHLLTTESLLNLLNETRYYTDGKTRKLTVGTANLAKFTGDYEYVKLTGEIVDVDDNPCELVDGCKVRCTWCASTDEGTMTVAEYMQMKGWQIA